MPNFMAAVSHPCFRAALTAGRKPNPRLFGGIARRRRDAETGSPVNYYCDRETSVAGPRFLRQNGRAREEADLEFLGLLLVPGAGTQLARQPRSSGLPDLFQMPRPAAHTLTPARSPS